MDLLISATVTALSSALAHWFFAGPWRKTHRLLSRPGWLAVDMVILLWGPALVLLLKHQIGVYASPAHVLVLLGVNAGTGLLVALGAVQWDRYADMVASRRELAKEAEYRRDA